METKNPIIAAGIAPFSNRSLNLIDNDFSIESSFESLGAVIANKLPTSTNRLNMRNKASNDRVCTMDSAMSGPNTTAKFVDILKYPKPAPRLVGGIMSATIATVAVVIILNQIPWINRNPNKRGKDATI